MNTLPNRLRNLALATVLSPVLLAPLAATAQIAPLQPPEIAARNYMLVDVTANQVLASKDVDAQIEPASLTKLMTAYLVFDALRAKKLSLEQRLPVSERAWKMPGSRMFIDPKMQVPVDDLIKGMIVQSGNDATMALAEGVGGTAENFVRLMNEQAKALGMSGTSYRNPEGLTEPGHLTTARDLSILSMRLMRDFPQYMHYYSTKEYRYEGTPAANSKNRNLLLFRDPSVDGLKTGHTNAAGYCLGPPHSARCLTSGDVACCRSCWVPAVRTHAPMKARSCSTGATPPTTRSSCSRPVKPWKKSPCGKAAKAPSNWGERRPRWSRCRVAAAAN